MGSRHFDVACGEYRLHELLHRLLSIRADHGVRRSFGDAQNLACVAIFAGLPK